MGFKPDFFGQIWKPWSYRTFVVRDDDVREPGLLPPLHPRGQAGQIMDNLLSKYEVQSFSLMLRQEKVLK